MLTGREDEFVQDNHSRSALGVLRGLHYQLERPLAKLVRVARGAIYDVAVDLRKSSRTFGCWVGAFLSAENHKQLWIPEGFAHGFQVISQTADVLAQVEQRLKDAGSDKSRILRTQIYLSDIREIGAMNEVYQRYFAADFPARSTVQVAALPRAAQVEIAVVAHYP